MQCEGGAAAAGGQVQPAEGSSSVDALDLGPFGSSVLKVRLQQYKDFDDEKMALAKKPPVRLANLDQNSHFWNTSPFAPSLLQGSLLFDLVREREVLPVEHLLIQGFPVPGFADEAMANVFPFPWHR